MKSILKNLAGQAAGQAVRRYAGNGAPLDPRRGWSLLRDRDVAVADKIIALGMGVVLTAVLTAAEIPVEAIVGLFLPVLGVGADLLFDGMEMVIGPVLFASLLMPHIYNARNTAKQKATVSTQRNRF